MKLHKTLSAAAAAFAAAGWVSFSVPAAAEYPERPLKVVVNFAAGGATHTLGRLFGEELEKHLGGKVAVTAVAGAGGAIGAAQVARARADGYTVLFGSNATAAQRWQISDTGYDYESFEPIASVAGLPTAWAVKVDSPIKTMKDLAAHIKANPGTKFASVGTGSSLHISTERWALSAGLEIDHVAARGGPNAIAKLMSGEAEFVAVAANNFPRQIREGREGTIRALAVASPQRYPHTPDVPTMTELGFEIVDVTWWGLFAPRGIPEEARAKLVAASAAAANAPAFLEILERFFYMPHYMGPEDVHKDLRPMIGESREVLTQIGLHKDKQQAN